MTQKTRIDDGRLARLVARLRIHILGMEQLQSERHLADEMGENRYMVRRALMTLREVGELPGARVKLGPGPRMARPLGLTAETNPVEMWEVRLMFEPRLARLAAARASPADIADLDDIHDQSPRDRFDLAADIAFHCAVARASGNGLAYVVIDLLAGMTRDASFRMKLPPFTSQTGFGHHARILSAIRARDPGGAETAMRLHLAAISQWLSGFPDDTLK